MNFPKSNNSNHNANALSNSSRDNNPPRFQNRNLNGPRGITPSTTRSGPPKPGVQVIQSKQRVGKAVGAAAFPPTPLNTPSLKRETQSNQTAPWNGPPSQGNEEGSPSLKGLSGPAKPAPWAKPGNTTEVEKTEELKPEPAAKQTSRSWANADDSEDEDRQENPPETEWPNFREPIDDLPPAKEDSGEGNRDGEHSQPGHQRYVPPFRNKSSNSISGTNEERRQYQGRNDHENFYDTKYGTGGGRFQQFNNNRQVDRGDREFNNRFDQSDTRNFRRDNRFHEDGDSQFSDNRSNNYRLKNRVDEPDQEHGQGDNRVSSRFNQDQDRYSHRTDRHERNDADLGYRNNARAANQSISQYENRPSDNRYPPRSNDYPNDARFPANRFHNRDSNAPVEQNQYLNKRSAGNYPSRPFSQQNLPPTTDDTEPSNYRERSRTLSEDLPQQKPGFHPTTRVTADPVPSDDGVDFKNIEAIRLEAEYLEQRKAKPTVERRIESTFHREDLNIRHQQQQQQLQPAIHHGNDLYGRQPIDSRRQLPIQHSSISRSYEQSQFEGSYDPRINNINTSNHRPGGSGPGGSSEDRWGRAPVRSAGPLSGNLPRPSYESHVDRDIVPDYTALRRDVYEPNVSGAYRGQDAVKLSFPQHPASIDDRLPSSESYSPHYNPVGVEPDYGQHRQFQHAWRDDGHTVNDSNRVFSGTPRNRETHISAHVVESNYETDLARNAQKLSIHSTSRSDDDLGKQSQRPRQLFDPKSNQLIDTTESQNIKSKAVVAQKEHKQPEKTDTDKWVKLKKAEGDESAHPSVPTRENDSSRQKYEIIPKVAVLENKSDEVEKSVAVDARKAQRQKERASREPRTKGFLYRYNQAGQLERVLSKWEKEQEELNLKKGSKGHEIDDSGIEKVAVLKKKAESDETERNVRQKTNDNTVKNVSSASPRSSAVPGSQSNNLRDSGLISNNEVSISATAVDNQGDANILGSIMQGALFDSWNRSNHSTIDDSRANTDLTSQSRMNWLGQTGSSPSFSPGLASLGSGLAGIISTSSNVSSSLFPNTQQDWAYNSIVLNNDSASNSLNPVFAPNNLNEINRPSSFSPFSGIIPNLQESGIIHSEKKESNYSGSSSLHRHADDPTAPAPDNMKFIQREWQKYAFGAVGNKVAAKPSKPLVGSSAADGGFVENSHATSPNSSNNNQTTNKANEDETTKRKQTDHAPLPQPLHHSSNDRIDANKDSSSTVEGEKDAESSLKPPQPPIEESKSHSSGKRENFRTADGGRGRGNRGRGGSVPTSSTFHARVPPNSSKGFAKSDRPVDATAAARTDAKDKTEIEATSEQPNSQKSAESSQKEESKPQSRSANPSSERGGYSNANANTNSNRRPYSTSNHSSGYNNSHSSRSSSTHNNSNSFSSSRSHSYNNNTNNHTSGNRSGGAGGGRGFSGPRAHSEVLAPSKANSDHTSNPGGEKRASNSDPPADK